MEKLIIAIALLITSIGVYAHPDQKYNDTICRSFADRASFIIIMHQTGVSKDDILHAVAIDGVVDKEEKKRVEEMFSTIPRFVLGQEDLYILAYTKASYDYCMEGQVLFDDFVLLEE